jgi:hypothetical protein
MFGITDLPELVADLRDGEADWASAYPVLLRLVGDCEVAELIRALPADVATRFAEALRSEFGDAELAEHGLWIDNAGGEPANRALIVGRIRRWLAASVSASVR